MKKVANFFKNLLTNYIKCVIIIMSRGGRKSELARVGALNSLTTSDIVSPLSAESLP